MDTLRIFANDTLLRSQGQVSEEFSSSVINMFFFLFILIIIIVSLAILYKKFVLKQGGFRSVSRSSIYELLQYQSIGAKEKILMIRITDTVQVILVNEHSIQVLKEILYSDYQNSLKDKEHSDNRFLNSLKDAMAYVKK